MLLNMQRVNRNLMDEDLKEEFKEAEQISAKQFRELGMKPRLIADISFDNDNFKIFEGKNYVFIELENNGIGWCLLQVMKKLDFKEPATVHAKVIN